MGGDLSGHQVANDDPAGALVDDDDILVLRRYAGGTLLCARDTIETYSRGGNFFTGIISLGEFVPYTRAEG